MQWTEGSVTLVQMREVVRAQDKRNISEKKTPSGSIANNAMIAQRDFGVSGISGLGSGKGGPDKGPYFEVRKTLAVWWKFINMSALSNISLEAFLAKTKPAWWG